MIGIVLLLLVKVYYAESVRVSTELGCNTTLTCLHGRKQSLIHSYEWYRTIRINNSNEYSGTDTETLTIINTDQNDAGVYACRHYELGRLTGNWGTTYTVSVHVDGKWSGWSQWYPCPVTCGGGTQYKTRQCDNPRRSAGGKECVGSKTEERECAQHICQVDGKWSGWSQWYTCPVTCGGGTQYKTRQCDNPPQSDGGKDCVGSKTKETRQCATRRCPVDGKWSGWSQWYTCPVTCGGGTQYKTRQCDNPPRSDGGKDCVGSKTKETRQCATRRCPVDGMWAYWSQWHSCPVTCGGGTQYRTRQCDNPPRSDGGKDCVGSKTKETKDCATHKCPVDGMWSGWSLSGVCSVTCGGGFQSMDRRCDNPSPAFGGEHCKGQHTTRRDCGTAPCPVDGMWSYWSQWHPCPVTCGGGTQYRTRQCDNPPRSDGGKDCVGSKTKETKDCATHKCPDWTDWIPWGSCETACGEGYRRRKRKCKYVGKEVNANNCPGTSEEVPLCHITPCQGEVGGILNITCRKSGRVRWYKDTQVIPYRSAKYTQYKGYLIIKKLEYNDDEKYKCGNRRGYTEVIIYGRPTIQTGKDKYYANTGSPITIKCIIGPSNPITTALWWTKINSHGQTTGILHDRTPGKYNGGTLSTPVLTINSVDATDNGEYMCHGKNSYGTTTATTTVNVGDVPVVNIPLQYYVSRIHESIILQCIVQNGNGSIVYWRKKGKTMYNTRGKYSKPTVDNPSLTIFNVKRQDSGTYNCITSNSFGHVSDSTELNVVYSHVKSRRYVNTANETVVLHCIVHDFNIITWWHNNGTLQGQHGNKYSVGDSRKPHLTINNLTRMDRGVYVCESSVDSVSARSDIITLNVKDIPFIEPSPTTVAVIAGNDVLLPCLYEAFPKPTEIYWEKDGDRLSIDALKYNGSSFTQPTLTIIMSEVVDSGMYSCNVRNSVGSGSSENIQLCVTEPESIVSAGPVAGCIVAAVVVLFVVLVVIFIVRRKRRIQKRSNKRYTSGVSRAEPYVNYKPGALNTSAVSNENSLSGSIMLQNENIPSGSVMVHNNTDDSQTYHNINKIKVDDLKNYIAMKQTTDALKEEYKKFPCGSQYPTAQAQCDENMPKNRFRTTFPYDHSRVILEEIHGKANSDYINADYIDGFKKRSCYVACQGPVKHTIEDHWRMIWQTNIRKIVMLTNLIEGGKVKCERYWPTGGKPMDVGNLNLTLTAEKERAAYITREISVVDKKTGQKRYIIQYHFTAWPDHGTPDSWYLVLFHKHVANDRKTEETGPLLVHCSAGIGRTGTYIALDALLEEGLATGWVDIAQFLAKMRYCRMGMIQTTEQYICLHYALLEAFTMKDTCIRKENFNNFWREILSDKRPINQNKLHEEFKMLQSQKSEHGKSDYTAALHTSNISKNRSRNVLPMDATRLFLVSLERGISDYINAVPVPSYTKFVGYITTQLPLPDTKVDFWTMIKDHDSSTIVLLLEDMKEIECVYSTLESLTCGPFTIKLKKQNIGDQCITEASLVMAKKNDRPKEIALYQAVCKSTPEPAVLCRLVNLISSRVSVSNDPVTVVSSDGAKNCGLFCALTNAVSSMQIDDRVDIFQIVRCLQLQRPEFFTDFNEYRMCYEALNFHIDTSNVYANF